MPMNSQTSKQSSFCPTMCLIHGDLGIEWKGNSQQKNTDWAGKDQVKAMKSMTSSNTALEFGYSTWLPGKMQTLSSLESNCESEASDADDFEDGVKAADMTRDEEMEVDDDYAKFCQVLSKSPHKDAASSSLICTSFVSNSFSFSITNDEDSEDDSDDSVHCDDTFECSGSYCGSSMGNFDPFAISGLFLPSLMSPLISNPSLPPLFETVTSCGGYSYSSGDAYDEVDSGNDELSQKLKDVNQRWQEIYASSEASSMPSQITKSKAVRFASESTFIDVLNKVEWADEYERARKGPWEQFYRDQLRFAQRIESSSDLLSRVLNSKHRDRIFRNLFETGDDVADVAGNSADMPLSTAGVS